MIRPKCRRDGHNTRTYRDTNGVRWTFCVRYFCDLHECVNG